MLGYTAWLQIFVAQNFCNYVIIMNVIFKIIFLVLGSLELKRHEYFK